MRDYRATPSFDAFCILARQDRFWFARFSVVGPDGIQPGEKAIAPLRGRYVELSIFEGPIDREGLPLIQSPRRAEDRLSSTYGDPLPATDHDLGPCVAASPDDLHTNSLSGHNSLITIEQPLATCKCTMPKWGGVIAGSSGMGVSSSPVNLRASATCPPASASLYPADGWGIDLWRSTMAHEGRVRILSNHNEVLEMLGLSATGPRPRAGNTIHSGSGTRPTHKLHPGSGATCRWLRIR
jgi:hypothetical protein